LHRSPVLWQFHKVHHSVEQMGFAAHLRYHWMETIVYRSIEYIPLALMGVGLYDFFVIHIFTLAVGHYNHSNITVPGTVTGGVLGGLIGIAAVTGAYDLQLLTDPAWYTQLLVFLGFVGAGALLMGPVMKRVFNSPEMHIWHHTYDLPKDKPYGVNYGITLALWDYIFQTAYVPRSGRDNRLGFPGVETFPSSFWQQITYGFSSRKKEDSEKNKEIHA
jgi:sterol desaturase/sphingolipid hydroxylase (fatty acid hydroxylase superfamily)